MKRLMAVIVLCLVTLPLGAAEYRNCHRSYQKAALIQHYVPPYQYFSVGLHIQEEALAERVSRRVLEKLSPYLRPDADRPAPEPPDPADATQDAAVKAIFERSCVACHGATKQDAGLKLIDDDGAIMSLPKGKLMKDYSFKIYGLVNSGIMPKGGDPLTDDEVKVIFDWAMSLNKEQ